MADFDEFWQKYPHNPRRKTKAVTKAIFDLITRDGGYDTQTKNPGARGYIQLHLEATPEEIVAGVDLFRKGLTDVNYKIDVEFSPNAVVWLNRGGWM